MYQKVRYTCRADVLLVKPLVCRFSLLILGTLRFDDDDVHENIVEK